MSASRWLRWTPESPVIGQDLQTELPKLPKGPSVSFGSSSSGSSSVIRPRSSSLVDRLPVVLPHCPRCGGYYLYRSNESGYYECQTCGLDQIAESIARRTH